MRARSKRSGGAPFATRTQSPVMPRCEKSRAPSSKRTRSHFPRRSTARTRRPSSTRENDRGEGRATHASRVDASVILRPVSQRASFLRTISTSGSSGTSQPNRQLEVLFVNAIAMRAKDARHRAEQIRRGRRERMTDDGMRVRRARFGHLRERLDGRREVDVERAERVAERVRLSFEQLREAIEDRAHARTRRVDALGRVAVFRREVLRDLERKALFSLRLEAAMNDEHAPGP